MNRSIGFHDASIVGYRSTDKTLELDLEDVQASGTITNAVVKFRGIRQITQDGVAVKGFDMQGDDAEILKLHLDVWPIFLLIEWQHNDTRQQTTATYEIFCDGTEVELNATDQPIVFTS